MRVIRHYDFDGFIAAVAPIAARGEASASFFIGSAHSMKRSPPRRGERVYLATCSGPDALGVALLRDEGPVLIGASDGAASAAFAADLAPDWPALQGVMGAVSGCDAFARKWKELTGRDCRLRVRLRQHVLTAVSDVPQSPGAARVAVAADADWIIARQVAFIEEVGLPDRPERLRELLPPRIERGDFRIWDDGGPVAYAGYNDAAPEFARIAPVYTLPECRGRGYATSLVAALSRELKERGKRKLFLTTDIANPTSNAIYARIGFRPENDDCGFDFIAPGA
jgi:predicted GNAT family acetyltransferase